ncbi:type IV pilus modification protein PilV [Pseudomonas sp. S25]|uniref:Type IV pilus modification protein PilV n=1 Tax=Pseudomonas maioricensis TaxID=1766623 RepID=A0ABS9ZGB7_9PSED|nr:type IV pilus modification protein PilV [Pseudomonas sp. S25]MCI8209116.1 type IV pilus modification protein PilV [Pseudomonas sp. S25]
MVKGRKSSQIGMTLIEVLVSVLILGIGLLGAAAIQLNALRYTDSSAMTSQASFIAYDMMDRIRANVDGNAANNGSNVLASYALASLANAPAASASNMSNAVTQDLADFSTNITNFAGTAGANSKIVIAKPVVTITITWDDTRAAAASDTFLGRTPGATNPQQFVLSTRIGVNDVVAP